MCSPSSVERRLKRRTVIHLNDWCKSQSTPNGHKLLYDAHWGISLGAKRQGMTSRWLLVSLVAVGTATPSFVSAQQRSPFPDPKIYTKELSPRQMQSAPDPAPLAERCVAPSSRVPQPP